MLAKQTSKATPSPWKRTQTRSPSSDKDLKATPNIISLNETILVR